MLGKQWWPLSLLGRRTGAVVWHDVGPHVAQALYIARMRRIFHGADELDKDSTVEYAMFDSGSTYTYFVPKVFKALLSAVQAQVRRWGFVRDRNDLLLSFCWRGKRKFKFVSDFSPYFGTINLDFGGSSVFELPPEGYLLTSEKGNVCLAIYEEVMSPLNIIGDISMRDYLIVFDNVRHEIGWVRKDCSSWDTGSP